MIVGMGMIPMIVGMGDLDPNQLAPDRQMLHDETQALLSAITQLAQDWFDSDATGIGQDQLTAWNSYVTEVRNWDSGPDFIAHPGLNKTWLDQLVVYEKKFNSFLQSFQAAGVQTSIPAFGFISNPGVIDKIAGAAEDAAKKAAALPGQLITYAVVGGLILVGLYVFTVFEAGRTVRATGIKVL